MSNPIVIKELIQGAHRKRTYALRAGLAGLGVGVREFENAMLRTGPGDRM